MLANQEIANINRYVQIVEDRKAGMSSNDAARKAGYTGDEPRKGFEKLKSDLRKRGMLDAEGNLTESANKLMESNTIQNAPIIPKEEVKTIPTESVKVVNDIPAESNKIVVKRNPTESTRSNKKDLRRRMQIDLDEEDIKALEKQAKKNGRTITNYCKYLIRNGAGLI